jgi:predicted amidohydrolase
VKVAAVQHDVVWQDREANFAHLSPLIAGAAGAGARLVVLTEMFSTGFGMDTDQTAEPFDGPSSDFLRTQSDALDVWVCGSVAERPAGGDGLPRNTLVLAGPGGAVHRYDKIHPFSYSGEHERYEAGDRFVTVEVEGVRLSLFVCYDLRFADEFWAVGPDTDCYVVVANWPETRRHHWRSLLVARAIENQAYVVGVNRVGEGGGLSYVGDSAIIDPLGETLAAGAKTEALLVAEVDPAVVTATRQRFPFLDDRR